MKALSAMADDLSDWRLLFGSPLTMTVFWARIIVFVISGARRRRAKVVIDYVASDKSEGDSLTQRFHAQKNRE